MSSWEIIKLKIQDQSQKSTRFRQKQAKCEITSLKLTLKRINKRIFTGDNLKFDRKLIEACLEQCVERHKFFCEADYTADWVCLEGKPYKSFLHLEDTKIQDPLCCLKDSNGVEVQTMDGILKILQEFYSELYACNELSLSEKEIEDFLNGIISLPRITYEMNNLIGPITSQEIHNAIKHLRTGKALGCDGLTSNFFKFFQEELADILPSVFNKIYEDCTLSPLQKLAIIILLFKKGDTKIVGNYWPISLTNCDYKILAYILVSCLEDHLPLLIHPNQIAYMKKRFIGTNIHSVQDVILNTSHTGTVVLFLDFQKAFDSVNHLFLFTLLAHIGLPPEFIV